MMRARLLSTTATPTRVSGASGRAGPSSDSLSAIPTARTTTSSLPESHQNTGYGPIRGREWDNGEAGEGSGADRDDQGHEGL